MQSDATRIAGWPSAKRSCACHFVARACVLLLLLSGMASAQVLPLDPGGSKWNLAPVSGCILDTTPATPSEGARPPDGPYIPLTSDAVNLGLLDASYWFRFSVHNSSDKPRDLRLELDNPRLGRAELFLPDGADGFEIRKAGLLVPRDERDTMQGNPSLSLRMEPGQTTTAYLRVKNRGWFLFRILLWDSKAFERDRIWRGLGLGMLYGGLLLMALQSAAIFLWLRDRSFLYNLLLVLSCLMYETTFQGTSSQYFWPNSPWWADRAIVVFFGLAMASAIAVSRSFLTTSLTTPKLDKVLIVLMYASLIVPFGKLTDSLLVNLAVHVIGCVAPPMILAAAILCWRKRFTPATIFLAAWGVLLVGAVCFNLAGAGVLPWNFFTETALHVGMGFAPLLFTIALADRVRLMEVKYRGTLERQVDERTQELREALANVKTLRGLVPICSNCKKVREDSGYWKTIERYVQEHSEADFTHGLCPECMRSLYKGDLGDRVERILREAAKKE